MLMGFVLVIIGITFYQEQKTERALDALRDLFQFAPLHRWEMALLFLSGVSSILFAESIKLSAVQKVIYRKDE